MISPRVKVVGCFTGRAGTVQTLHHSQAGASWVLLLTFANPWVQPQHWAGETGLVLVSLILVTGAALGLTSITSSLAGVCRSSPVLGLCCMLVTQLSLKHRLGNWAECDRLSELQGESQPQGHSSKLRLLGTGTWHHTPGFSWMITDEFQVYSLLKQLLYFKLFLYSVWNY